MCLKAISRFRNFFLWQQPKNEKDTPNQINDQTGSDLDTKLSKSAFEMGPEFNIEVVLIYWR